MSVVLRGLGLDQDSFSSIVAFGLTIDVVDVANPMPELENAGIEQMFAIDYSGFSRELTMHEWRQWRRVVSQVRKGRRAILRKERQMNKLNITFTNMLNPARKAA
jgi:hypothetical protein